MKIGQKVRVARFLHGRNISEYGDYYIGDVGIVTSRHPLRVDFQDGRYDYLVHPDELDVIKRYDPACLFE